MVAVKTNPIDSSGQQQLQRRLTTRPLLEEFSLIFYIGKYMGINSQDYQEFRSYKKLTKSPSGDCYVIIVMILIFMNFNLMVWVFHNIEYVATKDHLSVAIGFILTYFSLLTYLVDRITALAKQNQFIELFDTLQELEDEFMEMEMTFDNGYLKYRILFVILLASILEGIIFIFTFAFLVDRSNWSAWLWTFTAVPTFCNSLDKIWYTSIICLIRKRFEAINLEFDKAAVKLRQERAKQKYTISVLSIVRENKRKNIGHKSKVHPAKQVKGDDRFSISMSTIESISSPPQAELPISFDVLQERFVKLCQMHDGLCEVSKSLNELWALPNLVLMGYGFFIITAQLYFLYCSNSNQVIPSIFRPARNLGITAIYLLYISGKCISILLLSWLANVEAKKTGTCIHRCALAADKNDIYEMVNHLSLKLFNHIVDFNVCGYFPLNMRTLFSFCGGITTYLIILIQFNIEEQQVKSGAVEAKPLTAKVNESFVELFAINSTSILNQILQWSGEIVKSSGN